jgi:hypothetical protein
MGGVVVRLSVRAAVFCAVMLAVCAAGRRASADVTTEHGASILLFPRIIADGSRDTVVQVANLSNGSVHVLCSYVNAASTSWQSFDFRFALGAGRPTHWSAAAGRAPDEGQDSVDIPAAAAPFRGELICVQVGVDGAPLSGDDLVGEATVIDLGTGGVAGYAAAGLRSMGFNDEDGFLCIGGESGEHCPVGPEYEACPAEWMLSVPAEGAPDEQFGAGAAVATRLTVAPCSQDLQDALPGAVTILVAVVNELGQQFTASLPVTRWADVSLADIGGQVFTRSVLGSDFAEARFQPAVGSGGFILAAETTRSIEDHPLVTSAAVTAHTRGDVTEPDLLVLPMGTP